MSTTTGWTRPEIAAQVAHDIEEGWAVNLGIGMPLLVANAIDPEIEVLLQSENGLLGMGPAPAPDEQDVWLVNAGKQFTTMRPGASIVHHADSFAMIRGGHLDLCVLGAFEVGSNADLANWVTDAKDMVPGVGGAMDLAAGAQRIWIMTEHTTRTGTPKLVERCTYPLTAAGVVDRIYSDLAVIDVTQAGFEARRLAPGVSRELLMERTGAPVRFAQAT